MAVVPAPPAPASPVAAESECGGLQRRHRRLPGGDQWCSEFFGRMVRWKVIGHTISYTMNIDYFICIHVIYTRYIIYYIYMLYIYMLCICYILYMYTYIQISYDVSLPNGPTSRHGARRSGDSACSCWMTWL